MERRCWRACVVPDVLAATSRVHQQEEELRANGRKDMMTRLVTTAVFRRLPLFWPDLSGTLSGLLVFLLAGCSNEPASSPGGDQPAASTMASVTEDESTHSPTPTSGLASPQDTPASAPNPVLASSPTPTSQATSPQVAPVPRSTPAPSNGMDFTVVSEGRRYRRHPCRETLRM